MAKKLERKILTNVKTAREGMVNLRQAEGLFHHEILSALAHGEVTRGSSLVLVGVQSALYYKRACEYLMGKLPKNASLRQASGNLGIDFVICGPLAPDWVDRNITNVYEGKSQIFTSWKRFNAERFHRYQGRNLEEGIDVNKTVFLESKDDIVSFLRPILRSRDRAFYICNPSSLPIRSFVSFIRPDGVDNWSEGAEQWLGRIREESKLLEDVWDLYKVEVVKNESNDVNIRGAINNCSIVAILRFNDVEARNANAYEYSNSLRKFNEWRQSLSEHGLATVIHVAETLSMRESHEQYTVGGDIKGRLEKYSKSANFAFMGHETRNQEESLDLSMPLWNTIVFALAGTRKTLLAAHIAAAFLGSSFDVIYVSCKSASKLAYSKGFVSSDEFRYFAAPIKRLTGLITVPVKYYDLGKALSQPVIDGKARVLYTELIKDGGEDESAITRLGNVIPEESDGRQGRDVLLLFDELICSTDCL